MTFEQALPVGAVLLLGSVLQGTIGFAYTLFALPLLLWSGLDLSQAVALILVSIFVQVAIGAVSLWHEIPWSKTVWAALTRYATLPLGVALLTSVEALGQARVKQVIGVVLLVLIASVMLWRVPPRDKLHLGWGVAAFSLSGVLQGLAAVGGPPLVLWVMAHRWSNRQTRAFLFSVFLLTMPYQLLYLYFNFGKALLPTMATGLLFSPLVALGSLTGIRLGNTLPKPLLRKLAYTALLLMAALSILVPFVAP